MKAQPSAFVALAGGHHELEIRMAREDAQEPVALVGCRAFVDDHRRLTLGLRGALGRRHLVLARGQVLELVLARGVRLKRRRVEGDGHAGGVADLGLRDGAARLEVDALGRGRDRELRRSADTA